VPLPIPPGLGKPKPSVPVEADGVFQAVFRSLADGLLLVDDEGRTVEANPAACSLLGLSRESLNGRLLTDLGAPNADLPALRRTLREGGRLRGDWPLRRADGSLRSVELAVSRDVHSGLHLVVLRDLSEKHRLEEALRQSQKMEAVGRLAGSLAHDFNNYLTAIRGFGEVVLERLPPHDPLADNLLEIQKAADRATRLTRQLLAISRKQVLQPRPVDLNAVLSGLENMLRSLVGPGVRLHLALESGLAPVRADPGQLEQVVLNLVVNARDAMPDGGALVLQTARVEIRAAASHAGHLPVGRYVRLCVEDTGLGMDADTLSRVFEPFFTTKPAGLGTGLGLATVYGIVTQSGGHVAAHSRPGEGSVFTVYLPQMEGRAEAVPDLTAALGRGGHETVLVVEDEETLRQLLAQVLSTLGYAVLAAESGEEALRMAARRAEPIHLALTDVVLPGIDGCEMARQLAGEHPETRTLFMSGHNTEELVRHGVDPDSRLLQKPFTPRELASELRAVLDDEGPLAQRARR
jgi:two-component system cell cycle sensor histidine kinase/response regulator CckA